jgi:ketosteroid isomerase-like protein
MEDRQAARAQRLMAFTGPVADRLAIRERYNSYADAATNKSLDNYLACWHADGLRIGQGAECRGIEALRTQWLGLWDMLDRMAFFSEVGAIVVDGDRAVAHVNCREIIVLNGGELWKVVGRYDDELVRQGDDWVFARRAYTMLIDEKALTAR